MDLELGAAARRRAYRDRSPVLEHDPLHEREPEARALSARREERLEDLRTDGPGDPGTAVLEVYPQFGFPCLNQDRQLTSLGHRVARVQRQIQEQMVQGLGPPAYRDTVFGLPAHDGPDTAAR